MPTLDELLNKHEITTVENPGNGPRAKLLNQADRMLSAIAKYKDVSELNSDNAKFWWAPQAVNGKRKITAKYGGRAVDGLSTYVDDSIDAVTEMLKKFRAVIVDSDDNTWAKEEEKRKK